MPIVHDVPCLHSYPCTSRPDVHPSVLHPLLAELSLHYLAKAKIMVVRDIERDDIEFISKVGQSLLSDVMMAALFSWLGR